MSGSSFRENQTCTKSWLPLCVAFAPLFPKGNWPFFGTGKTPFCGKSYYFYRVSCMNLLLSPPENCQVESSTRSLKAPLKVPPKGPPKTHPLRRPLRHPLRCPLRRPLRCPPPSSTPYCALEGALWSPSPWRSPEWGLRFLKGRLKGYLKGSGGAPSMRIGGKR